MRTHDTATVRGPVDEWETAARGFHHLPELRELDGDEDVRCDLCNQDASRPHAQVCALGKKKDGTPRYPGVRIVRSCRGVVVCFHPHCEAKHFTARVERPA